MSDQRDVEARRRMERDEEECAKCGKTFENHFHTDQDRYDQRIDDDYCNHKYRTDLDQTQTFTPKPFDKFSLLSQEPTIATDNTNNIMKTELTPQIAAMYLGCSIEVVKGKYRGMKGRLRGVNEGDLVTLFDSDWADIDYEMEFDVWKIKLHLRPLSSMTEEEAREVSKLWNVSEDAQNIKHLRKRLAEYSCSLGHWMKIQPYLLSKGFDLFGLIDSGHAIER